MKSHISVTVPTVERGLRLVDFCSIDITGLKPVILSTSGRSSPPINCLAYAEKLSKYLRCPSAYIVSNANDDLPLPLSPVMTTSWFRGMLTSMFLRLWTRLPNTSIVSGSAIERLLSSVAEGFNKVWGIVASMDMEFAKVS